MAGGIDWFRWHHGTSTDEKFGLVAKKAGARRCEVLALWGYLLERASAATVRGTFGAIDREAVDYLLEFDDGLTARILQAFDARRLTKDGRFVAWEARQPKREREDNSADRVAKHRNAKKGPVTPSNASGSQETPRGEESREEAVATTSKSSESALRSPVDVARACLLLMEAGCPDAAPTNPHLIAAFDQGITAQELIDLAKAKPGKGIAYLCQAARGKRADAAASGGAVADKPEPLRNPEGSSPRLSRAELKRREQEVLDEARRQHPEHFGPH